MFELFSLEFKENTHLNFLIFFKKNKDGRYLPTFCCNNNTNAKQQFINQYKYHLKCIISMFDDFINDKEINIGTYSNYEINLLTKFNDCFYQFHHNGTTERKIIKYSPTQEFIDNEFKYKEEYINSNLLYRNSIYNNTRLYNRQETDKKEVDSNLMENLIKFDFELLNNIVEKE